MSIFLLIIYFILIIFFVYKSPFFYCKKINRLEILWIISLKLIIGVFYVYVNKLFIVNGDIFLYFQDGKIIHELLYSKPLSYLHLVFLPNNVNYSSNLANAITSMGFWEDTDAYFMVRVNALLLLISNGNIYIHGLFAGLVSFIGSFLIAKVFIKLLNINKIVALSIFLTPSLLFWTAGIHKESFSILALGIILYNYFILIENFKKPISIIFFIIGIFIFYLTRDYMLLALIPSLFSYFIYKKLKLKFLYSTILSVVLIGVFLNYYKFNSYSRTGIEIIIDKRIQFNNLVHGNTFVSLNDISPNIYSLIKNSPQALFNTILRPHFGDISGIFMALMSIENFIISLLLFVAIFNFRNLNKRENEIISFMFLYSIFLLLIIGWIVPSIGAIVRYRSVSYIIFVPSIIFVISKSKFILRRDI